MKRLVSCSLFLLLSGTTVAAMDLQTHDMVIEKIRQGLATDPAPEIRLRLADLFSDRARLKALKEAEKSCQNCEKSKEDRLEALALYQVIFDKLSSDEQIRSFEQIAQAYTILNKKTEGKRFYQKVISGKYPKALKARAHLHTADQEFFSHKYVNAHKEYKKALALDSSQKSALIGYRMSWCEFNQGQYEVAKAHLGRILKSQDEKLDAALRSGMTADYARFSAKGPIDRNVVKDLHQVSGQTDAKANVELLANELDRLGRAAENILVNHYLLEEFETDPKEKAFAYLRLAQAELSLKRIASVVVSFDKSMQQATKIDCEKLKNDCQDYQSRAQKFVVYWDQVEKDKPSQSLHRVWQSYLSVYADDHNMQYLAAKSFHKGQKVVLAQKHYLKSAEIVHKEESRDKRQHLEASLDAAMACAEESNLLEQRRQAYQAYRDLNPKGPKALHALYQLGFIEYQTKNYTRALPIFEQVLNEYTKNQSKDSSVVAKKSAHLILDTLAAQKNNRELMAQSLRFSQLFAQDKSEFLVIYRRALLNESVAVLKSAQKDHVWIEELVKRHKGLQISGLEKKEKGALLESRLQLAKQVQALDEVQQTAAIMIGQKDLSQASRDQAFAAAIWASEMGLNFGKAYEYAKMQKPASQDRKIEDHLRLGLLAEMAQRNPKVHYEAALTKTRGVLESNRLRAKIVQNSATPWQELMKRLQDLKKSPQLLSELALETFARYTNIGNARKVLESANVANKPAGVRLQRYLDLPQVQSLIQQVRTHQISKQSESRSQKDLVKRMEYLTKIEALANQAVARKDTVLQVATLSSLAEQKARLARELLQLPQPRGLSAADKAQYQKILTGKAQQMDREAKVIQAKVDQVWASGMLVKALEDSLQNSSPHLQAKIMQEIQLLNLVGQDSHRSQLARIDRPEAPQQAELTKAREQLKAKPFDVTATRRLLEAEKKHANFTQVAYYQIRLNSLEKRILP